MTKESPHKTLSKVLKKPGSPIWVLGPLGFKRSLRSKDHRLGAVSAIRGLSCCRGETENMKIKERGL